MKGHKIGLTSCHAGYDRGHQTDYGFIYDDWFVLEGETIERSSLNRPLVEVELAFVMKEELKGHQVNGADVIRQQILFCLP